MGILDIIYHMVNKSGGKKEKEKKKSKSNTKTKQKKKKENKKKIIVEDISNTEELLNSWNESVKTVSDHPLSQVKIINTQILEQLSTILTSMNKKLKKLDKLDEVLKLLKESRKEIILSGKSTEKLDKAISGIEDLTIKDEEVINVIKDKGPQNAESLADYIGVSRSTASNRLNRLHKKKVLRKKSDGREVFFSLCHKNKD